MKKFKTLAISMVCGLFFSTSTIYAENVDYKTVYDVETSTVYNSQEDGLIHVVGDNKDIFLSKPVEETVYTTAPLNLRDVPNTNSNPVAVLQKNSELLKVGDSDCGWDIVQIDGVNYFVWGEYLTTEKPMNVVNVETIQIQTESKIESQPSQYLGQYKLTAYCACSSCCGQWANGITASGTTATQGRTVACNSLPLGTKIIINGNTYIVEDTGGMSNNVIDVFFNSHSEALSFGVQYADVYLAE